MTICVSDRRCVLGEVKAQVMQLSRIGEIVDACWRRIPTHFGDAYLDRYVVMPNHVHGIICLFDDQGEAFARNPGVGSQARGANASPLRVPRGTVGGSLGAVVQNFKSVSTRRVNQARETPGSRLWQRNYFDRVIGDEEELGRIRKYIQENPLRWHLDKYNPFQM